MTAFGHVAITVRTPGDLLAYISYRLGFRPEDSIVLAALGPAGEIGLVARADLEGCDLGMQRLLARRLVVDGAVSAVVAVYSDACEDPTRPPSQVREVVATLREELQHVGIGSVAWIVGRAAYACLECAGGCCPPGGRGLDEIVYGGLAARLVFAGLSLAPSRSEGLRLPVVGDEARGRARWAAHRCGTRFAAANRGEQGSGRHGGPETGLLALRTASLEDWRTALAADRPDPARCGRIGAALHDVITRDAVLLSAIGGHDAAADRVVRRDRAEPLTAAATAALLDPRCAAIPGELTRRAVSTLEMVAAHVGAASPAPVLALAGLLAWWCGDGARANERTDEALAADATHTLARLVDLALRGGVAPGWIGARSCGRPVMR